MKRIAALATALIVSASACAAQAQDGDAAYRAGRYEDAVSIFTRRIEGGGHVDGYRGLARVYLETGRYADAEKLLRGSPHETPLSSLLSDALRMQGRTADARVAAEAGLRGPDSLNARLRLASIAYDAGRKEEALALFDRFIDSYNEPNAKLSSDELIAVGVAVRHLGDRDPQLFKDALKAFDEAIAADAGNHNAHVSIGRLFLDKYNSGEAQTAFANVLKLNPRHPDALVGMAEVLAFEGQPGAVDTARKALLTNPNHLAAHMVLTHAFLLSESYDSARAHAQAASRINPEAIESLIAAASVAQMTGDTKSIDQIRARVVNNPVHLARLNVALAELSVQQRQYAAAVRLALAAAAADSMSWRAWSVAGVNQLRLGDAAAARQSLERSFKGDPYNVWVKNTLDLLDRLDKFETRSSGHFEVIASEREAGVLTPYVTSIGEEAFAKLAERYGYTPPLPIRIELFDRHADFSVRTVGLAGLGALGAAFGSVLVMDAPSARKPGEFNWAATFWHELAHAFHLGMTNHRVPRWFTEGLAVLEERRARKGWGEEGLPMFVSAARQKKLLPLADLNSGFVRPSYPSQVQVSYYQASLILEMIEARYGAPAIRGMLRGFAAGKATDAVLRDVLKTTPQAIDAEFRAYTERTIADASRAEVAEAVHDYAALVRAGTLESLEQAINISPYDIDVHIKLAGLYASSGDRKAAVRERQVIVALQPVDMAEARYQLALAHFEAGDVANARREVVRALEHAPNFERAQELLLKLSGNTP